MFSRRRRATAAVMLLLVWAAASCSSAPPKPDVERLAVVAFDNQSADASATWAGHAAAALTAAELAGAGDLYAYTASSMAAAWEQRPTHSLEGYLVRERQSRWRLYAHRRDVAAGRTTHSYSVAGAHPGELANKLVAAMSRKPAMSMAAGIPAEAIELYGRWLMAPQSPQALDYLRRAVAVAPRFTEAARINALATAASGDRAQATAALEAALGQASASPLEQAKLKHALAQIAGAGAGVAKSSRELSDLAPADSALAEQAANAAMLTRDYAAGALLYKRAQRADPHSADLNNNAAYAFVLAGDLDSARRAATLYQALAPASGNPLDSLGEVLCMAGRFDEAAAAFTGAYAKEPALLDGATLRKAAYSQLLGGQPAEADKLFARYAGAGKQMPAMPLERAQWDYARGRKAEALAAAQALAEKNKSASAWAQVSAWRLAQGEADAAARAAKQAWAAATTAAERNTAALAMFASQQDASAATWESRAAQQITGPAGAALRDPAVAYALLLRRQYAAAVPVLRRINAQRHPARATEWQALLAIALMESGKAEKAKPLLRTWPAPRSFGDGVFDFLIYPAIRKWMTAS